MAKLFPAKGVSLLLHLAQHSILRKAALRLHHLAQGCVRRQLPLQVMLPRALKAEPVPHLGSKRRITCALLLLDQDTGIHIAARYQLLALHQLTDSLQRWADISLATPIVVKVLQIILNRDLLALRPR